MALEQIVLAAVVALAAGLGIGVLLWAGPLGRVRSLLGEAKAELAGAAARLGELEPVRAQLEATLARAGAAEARLAALEMQAAERAQAHEEQKATLLATGEALKAEFERLAQEALKGSQTQFLEVAEEAIKRQREAADAELKNNKQALSELLTPVADTLGRYEKRMGEVEAARVEGYGKLTTLLDELGKSQAAAVTATARLETALRSSGKAAGRWGEEQCRNVLEMAGLVEGVDFTAQGSVEGESGRQRPDFTVMLPGGRLLVVDVKCSLDAFVTAAEAASDEERARALKAHAAAVRAHAVGLAGKSYEKSVAGAVDFVVLFVPGENFLAAAIEQDRTLMNDFMNKRVVLAGPINLIAVARTVAAMRDQARLAKEAAEIARLGRDLYDSLRIMAGNIGAVQRSLGATVTGWNKLVTQLDSRVMLRARRFEHMGATTGLEPMSEIAAVELVPLLPSAPELLPPPRSEAAE